MSRSTSDGCACLALALTARFTIYGSCKPYQKVQHQSVRMLVAIIPPAAPLCNRIFLRGA
jgi:hypothetical protein